MSNFAHVEHLLHFATKGFVCLLACKLLQMPNIDGVPKKKMSVQLLAEKIVEEVWHQPGDNQEANVVQAHQVEDIELDNLLTFANICKCREGKLSTPSNHKE